MRPLKFRPPFIIQESTTIALSLFHQQLPLLHLKACSISSQRDFVKSIPITPWSNCYIALKFKFTFPNMTCKGLHDLVGPCSLLSVLSLYIVPQPYSPNVPFSLELLGLDMCPIQWFSFLPFLYSSPIQMSAPWLILKTVLEVPLLGSLRPYTGLCNWASQMALLLSATWPSLSLGLRLCAAHCCIPGIPGPSTQ